MSEGSCAIWGTPSQIDPITGDFEIHNSQRAGGKYRITGTAKAVLISNYAGDETFKAKLTSWLVEQRMSGFVLPEIVAHDYFFKRIKERDFISTTERVQRFLLCCKNLNVRLGEELLNGVPWKSGRNSIAMGLSYHPKYPEIYA